MRAALGVLVSNGLEESLEDFFVSIAICLADGVTDGERELEARLVCIRLKIETIVETRYVNGCVVRWEMTL